MVCMVVISMMCVFGGNIAFAGEYPKRPITLICPWGAGGGTDAVARIIATLLKDELGVPVNVVNRTGGSGAVGHTAMATAKPDGYTIGMPTVEITMMHWLGLTELSYKDIAPIAVVNFDPAGISVKADSPWKTYEELEKHVLSQGGMKGSGTGRGGIWHLAMAGWLKAIGADPSAIKWIPSKGAAPALQDLMAGGVDVVTCSLPEASTLIDAGKVKPLASMAPAKDPMFPEVKPLKDLGKHWVCGTWRAIAAPKGTPENILATLEKAVGKVVKSKEYVDFMNNRGYGLKYMNRAEFKNMLVKADRDNGDILKAAKIAK